MKYAVDFKHASGEPTKTRFKAALAAAPGVVIYAGQGNDPDEPVWNYGRYVEIYHAGGWFTRYAHLDSVSVTKGDTVDVHHIIGLIGSSGIPDRFSEYVPDDPNRPGNPHLHFELHKYTPERSTATEIPEPIEGVTGLHKGYRFWHDKPGDPPPPLPTTTNNAAFITDVTVPDGTTFAAGEAFQKIWRIKNTGTSTWGPGFKWTFDGGDQMSGPLAIEVGLTSPGATWDASVNLTAPTSPGGYQGYWRMEGPDGTKFGTRVYVQIGVRAVERIPIIVDDRQWSGSLDNVGYFHWGTPSYWREGTDCGFDAHYYYTWSTAGGPLDNVGQWRPNLPGGSYEVFAYIPHCEGRSSDARYEIWINGSHVATRSVNQLALKDQWATLGTYSFPPGAGSFIRLGDVTNESDYFRIVHDAVKFEPR